MKNEGGHIYLFLQMDPSLELYRKELVVESGRKLDKARMIRFEERTSYFASTDLGRTASHFYIRYNTIEVDIRESHSTRTALIIHDEEMHMVVHVRSFLLIKSLASGPRV